MIAVRITRRADREIEAYAEALRELAALRRAATEEGPTPARVEAISRAAARAVGARWRLTGTQISIAERRYRGGAA
jgi:hypothetical protein